MQAALPLAPGDGRAAAAGEVGGAVVFFSPLAQHSSSQISPTVHSVGLNHTRIAKSRVGTWEASSPAPVGLHCPVRPP